MLDIGCLLLTAACSRSPQPADSNSSIAWVRSAAEFEALCLQAYRAAGDFLPQALADPRWSALPGQTGAEELPPAIIFDIDETLVTNIDFQATFEPPFTNAKLDEWNAATVAHAIPGAPEFVRRAREAGAELFFVSNRPCEPKPGGEDKCPQEAVTIQDLIEAGIEADPEHVLLANERPGWDREKVVRRDYIARTHRVIMLIGDDLTDFIACTRHHPRAPCGEAATLASRRVATREYRDYWGAGWFVLPNPIHGSWTEFAD